MDTQSYVMLVRRLTADHITSNEIENQNVVGIGGVAAITSSSSDRICHLDCYMAMVASMSNEGWGSRGWGNGTGRCWHGCCTLTRY
jgi:hypothetical protein